MSFLFCVLLLDNSAAYIDSNKLSADVHIDADQRKSSNKEPGLLHHILTKRDTGDFHNDIFETFQGDIKRPQTEAERQLTDFHEEQDLTPIYMDSIRQVQNKRFDGRFNWPAVLMMQRRSFVMPSAMKRGRGSFDFHTVRGSL